MNKIATMVILLVLSLFFACLVNFLPQGPSTWFCVASAATGLGSIAEAIRVI